MISEIYFKHGIRHRNKVVRIVVKLFINCIYLFYLYKYIQKWDFDTHGGPLFLIFSTFKI